MFSDFASVGNLWCISLTWECENVKSVLSRVKIFVMKMYIKSLFNTHVHYNMDFRPFKPSEDIIVKLEIW